MPTTHQVGGQPAMRRPPAVAGRPSRRRPGAPSPVRIPPSAGPALMFGSALSNQLGAATGALAFGVIGPAGVVAIRQWIAGIALLAAAAPVALVRRGAVAPVPLLRGGLRRHRGFVPAPAIGRLGLGLAVTLNFLGPLAVRCEALSRQRPGPGVRAGEAGVVVLTHPRRPPTTSASASACWPPACWASYVLLNRRSGGACPAPRARRRPRRCPHWSSCRSGSRCCLRHPPR